MDTKQRLNVGWSRYFVSMAVFSIECVLYRMCLQNLFSMECYNICSNGPLQTQPRDGQTCPHRPRLVGSRSTCPPLSPFPDANSFMIGTAAINTHIPPARAALLPRHALTYRVTQTVCVLLLQDLLQSCSRGGRRRVDDMCYERRRAEACVDESAHHALGPVRNPVL